MTGMEMLHQFDAILEDIIGKVLMGAGIICVILVIYVMWVLSNHFKACKIVPQYIKDINDTYSNLIQAVSDYVDIYIPYTKEKRSHVTSYVYGEINRIKEIEKDDDIYKDDFASRILLLYKCVEKSEEIKDKFPKVYEMPQTIEQEQKVHTYRTHLEEMLTKYNNYIGHVNDRIYICLLIPKKLRDEWYYDHIRPEKAKLDVWGPRVDEAFGMADDEDIYEGLQRVFAKAKEDKMNNVNSSQK